MIQLDTRPIDLDFEKEENSFGPEEEKAIISIAFDEPEFFSSIARYLKPDHFQDFATQYVYSVIRMYYDDHNIVITRELCRDNVLKQLTADNDFEPILKILDRKSNPREVPIIKESLIGWAKERAYAELYSSDALSAFESGNYSVISNIIEEANKITDVSSQGSWFFQDLDSLFVLNEEAKLTCGFPRLDAYLNNGGPTFGDVLCWMAPTGVGKSIMLVNSGVANLKRGQNVLHITCELSEELTKHRYMGVIAEKIPIRDRMKREDKFRKIITKFRSSYESDLVVYEFPPDDISVDTVQSVIEYEQKQNGFNCGVVIIDYLELLLSRIPAYNSMDDYIRQKRVSTEIRRLAKKTNTLIFTASQTNRSGTDVQDSKTDKVIDLNKVAESYGKTMPMDYIITINQNKNEYLDGLDRNAEGEIVDMDGPNTNAVCRFFIAKNRNGPKFAIVTARINYETMKVIQQDI